MNGNLIVRSGFFEVSPLTGYGRNGDPGFPMDPAYLTSKVLIHGNLNLPAGSILGFHLYNKAITATISVKGAAVLAGSLQAGVEDLSKVDFDDKFTVLTADKIAGQFANVPSGGRVKVYGRFDDLGNPVGKAVGTFRVTYGGDTLVLSDFQRE